MIASDHNRSLQLTALDHVVESQTKTVAFAVSKPTYARWQSLKGHTLPRHPYPLRQPIVIRELFEHCSIGGGDIARITRQSHPPERALPLAEQRTNVGREKARIVEGPVEATELGLGAKTVAVVKHLGAGILKPDHGRAVRGHRQSRPPNHFGRIICAQTISRVRREVVWDIRQRVVGTCLVGHDVGRKAVGEKAREHVGSVAHDADR